MSFWNNTTFRFWAAVTVFFLLLFSTALYIRLSSDDGLTDTFENTAWQVVATSFDGSDYQLSKYSGMQLGFMEEGYLLADVEDVGITLGKWRVTEDSLFLYTGDQALRFIMSFDDQRLVLMGVHGSKHIILKLVPVKEMRWEEELDRIEPVYLPVSYVPDQGGRLEAVPPYEFAWEELVGVIGQRLFASNSLSSDLSGVEQAREVVKLFRQCFRESGYDYTASLKRYATGDIPPRLLQYMLVFVLPLEVSGFDKLEQVFPEYPERYYMEELVRRLSEYGY